MNFIKNLFKKENSKSDTVSFEPTELQIAVSKILVRTAKIDDEFHILEEQKILELLTKYFSLNDEDSKNLMELGISEEKSATDLNTYRNDVANNCYR